MTGLRSTAGVVAAVCLSATTARADDIDGAIAEAVAETDAVYGAAPRRSTELEAGEAAPFAGRLLDPELAKDWVEADARKTEALRDCGDGGVSPITWIAAGTVLGVALAVLGGVLSKK